jgi:cytochrome bd ubiquinol oxidase subunit II
LDLNIIWFLLIGGLLTGYAILDGFDLGAGILQFFTKTEEEKRTILKAIGPFWDGNEVWLLTGGGAIFAAFPHVYATVFSGFYMAIMLLLVGLIFRALSIEFRNQVDSAIWKNFWDKAFSVASLIVALLLGVALGNIFIGIPLDGTKNFTGSFFTLLRPVPLAIGLTGVIMFILQGSSFLAIKTSGDLQSSAKVWIRNSWRLLIIFLILTVLLVAVTDASKITTIFSNITGYLILLVLLAALISLPIFLNRGYPVRGFLSSSLIIFSMMAVVGATIFPNMVPALNPEFSLTIYNASSTPLTLTVMLVMALIGMPIVVAYTAYIYLLFRKID